MVFMIRKVKISEVKAKKSKDKLKNFLGGIIMRFSRDERKLLAFYAKKARQPQGNCLISDNELIKLLKFSDKEHLHNIKRKLKNLRLIDFTDLQKHVVLLNVKGQQVPKEVHPNIMVTQKGFDLGIKYNSVFGLFRVWLNEYYKWLMLVAAIIAAIISVISVIIGIMTLLK